MVDSQIWFISGIRRNGMKTFLYMLREGKTKPESQITELKNIRAKVAKSEIKEQLFYE